MTFRLDPGGILCLLPKGLEFQGPQSVVLLVEKEQRGECQKGLFMAGSGSLGQVVGSNYIALYRPLQEISGILSEAPRAVAKRTRRVGD